MILKPSRLWRVDNAPEGASRSKAGGDLNLIGEREKGWVWEEGQMSKKGGKVNLQKEKLWELTLSAVILWRKSEIEQEVVF